MTMREPLPKRYNLDRLLHAMAARHLDGIVATTPQNVFYLTGFNAIAHKSDEPRPYAVMLEQRTTDGNANSDWTLQKAMVVPLHLLVPGGDRERYWLEEVVVVTEDGGRPLFSWGSRALNAG